MGVFSFFLRDVGMVLGDLYFLRITPDHGPWLGSAFSVLCDGLALKVLDGHALALEVQRPPHLLACQG